MTKPDNSETGQAPASKVRGRITAIAALVAAVAAFVGNLDKISDVTKEWIGTPEQKSPPVIVVQITRETLLEAARQAQVAAASSSNNSAEEKEQAENLKRVANSIASPISLSGTTSAAQPKWLKVAFGELGEAEIPGPDNNARVVEYLESVSSSLAKGGDEMPWNAAFINWAFKQSGVQPKYSAVARAWLSWGQKISSPRLGALAIFSRPGSEQTGTLCLYLTETEDQVLCLGGNLYNSVQLSAQNKANLLAYRWPSDVQPGTQANVSASAAEHGR